MNRRSFFSFLCAAPVGLPVALAGMSSADGFVSNELHQARIPKLGLDGTSGPCCAGAVGVRGRAVDLVIKTRTDFYDHIHIRAILDHVAAGRTTPNEARATLGLGALEGGDVLYVANHVAGGQLGPDGVCGIQGPEGVRGPT